MLGRWGFGFSTLIPLKLLPLSPVLFTQLLDTISFEEVATWLKGLGGGIWKPQ